MIERFRVFTSKETKVGNRSISLSPDQHYIRTLICTGFIASKQSPACLVRNFVPDLEEFEGKDKVICLGAKAISVMQGRYKRINEIKPSRFSIVASKFGTKTEHGTGVAGHPAKLQVAIDEVGLPRLLLASGISAMEKTALRLGILKNKLGLFFIVAGMEVKAIDGLVEDGGYHNHVILCPNSYQTVCDEIESQVNAPIALADINDIGGSVLSVSQSSPLTRKEVYLALKDNPFGQDKRRTPLAVIGRV